ncbi:MAG: hypothetical protein IPF51_16225 [Dehalococcoidia bacterium]|uniref:hypothetical protein n=1 Tax=Candidatus Amarobacter glycogenicus TaxID=3140699 RepID=UPI00313720F9|nr:hypothetical protein [Dehalococcoidia bacterium]
MPDITDLTRRGIVVGTSVGSLNGAWIALHPDRPGGTPEDLAGLDRLSLVKFHPARMAARLFTR